MEGKRGRGEERRNPVLNYGHIKLNVPVDSSVLHLDVPTNQNTAHGEVQAFTLAPHRGDFILHGENLGMLSGLDLAFLTWTVSTAVTLLAVSGPSIVCVPM